MLKDEVQSQHGNNLDMSRLIDEWEQHYITISQEN